MPAPRERSSRRRRHLTILFSDLCGSVRLSSMLEAEVFADLVRAVWTVHERRVTSLGGRIFDLHGDGILAGFGHPSPAEDDARRALDAALSLHAATDEIAAMAPGVPAELVRLHIGVHSGLVLVDEGPGGAGLSLFGQPVNVAARLSDLAEAGETLVSEAALGPVRRFYDCSPPTALRLQGVAEPIPCVLVGGRRRPALDREPKYRGSIRRLVGRQAEMAELRECLSPAGLRRGAAAAVLGEAGAGKSRLLEERLAELAAPPAPETPDAPGDSPAPGLADGRPAAPRADAPPDIHRGVCERFLGAEPFQPFVQMLRRLGPEAVEGAPATERAALDRLLAPGAAASAEALGIDTMSAALVGVFARRAARAPQLLCIDDLHWADAGARRVLADLLRARPRGVSVLAATRGEGEDAGRGLDAAAAGGSGDGVDGWRFDRLIRLGPIGEAACREAVGLLKPGLSGFESALCCEVSGGNPLFLEEVCHALSDVASDPRAALDWRLDAWLEQTIETRLHALPERLQTVVHACAAVGPTAPRALVDAVLDPPPAEAELEALAHSDLLYPSGGDGALTFKHGIARDVIYRTIGLEDRRALHARIAAALERGAGAGPEGPSIELLAHHAWRAGDLRAAAEHAEKAGDKAAAASALDRAGAQFSVALDALEQLPQDAGVRASRVSVACRLAFASVFDPSAEAIARVERARAAAEAAGDRRGAARIDYWAGYLLYAAGDGRRAVARLGAAAKAARQIEDANLAVQAAACLGNCHVAAGRHDAAEAVLGPTLAAMRPHLALELVRVGYAYALASRAASLADRGDYAAADAAFEEALETVRGLDHEVEGSVLLLWNAAALQQGRWEAAAERIARARAVAERVRSLYLALRGRAAEAYAGSLTDPGPGSLAALLGATERLEARGMRLWSSLSYGWLAEAAVARGDLVLARRAAAQALARARADDRLGEIIARRALAPALAAAGDARGARRRLAAAFAAAEARGSRPELALCRLAEGRVALELGERDAARAGLERAGEALEALDMAGRAAGIPDLLARL
ncbi:ATP-binding protein [Albimonas pacifica]|uniref:Predicted ATPase n=1 Tax=Albimonas pacifica TaxID=1114924 RepID=A0A1I3EIE0_9RHOB|nr:adenylate/guanylate cyclase domain-containing protein [Albimonas pacifica]SFH98739.1 Predicted ATPase [Albimonas pacifica]